VIALVALVLASPLPLPPSVRPWPIGAEPGFRVAAAPPAVRAGRPVAGFTCGTGGGRYGVHIELFVRRQVLIVPGGVGVAAPWRASFGRIRPGRCTYPLRTRDATGVIEVGRRATLGDFFAVWGQRLGPRRIAGFRARKPVLAFVDGRRWVGDPRRIPLARHANIVLELGGYVPPHPRYLFPPGL
jgi:hypothetical protein